MDDDPFVLVQSQVQSALTRLHHLRSSLSSPISSSERDWIVSEIASLSETIASDIEDLDSAVQVARQNPFRFNLSPMELSERESFLRFARDQVNQERRDGNGNGNGDKDREGHPLRRRSPSPSPRPLETVSLEEEVGDTSALLHHQEEVMRDQDTQLDSVMNTVATIRNVAETMHVELDNQYEMLQDLNERVDRTQGRMDRMMAKLKFILRGGDSEARMTRCMWILVVVVVILLILVIYT